VKVSIFEMGEYFTFKIETKKYRRYIQISKSGFKLMDLKVFKSDLTSYRKTLGNKWVLHYKKEV